MERALVLTFLILSGCSVQQDNQVTKNKSDSTSTRAGIPVVDGDSLVFKLTPEGLKEFQELNTETFLLYEEFAQELSAEYASLHEENRRIAMILESFADSLEMAEDISKTLIEDIRTISEARRDISHIFFLMSRYQNLSIESHRELLFILNDESRLRRMAADSTVGSYILRMFGELAPNRGDI